MRSAAAATGIGPDPDFLYEFDREPVPQSRLLGPGHFAGEHVAATEFVIGVTFVNWGASVQDIFAGLAVGNLLAVLTWTLVCAPIAIDTRLTLYWYLRKIGGPRLNTIYSLVNACLYSIMAGCMITVSASAVRIPFGIPPQLDWYPTDARFVLVVLAVGAVVVTLAVLGFAKLAVFATVCSPWMFLMFVVGAMAVLPELVARENHPAGRAGDHGHSVLPVRIHRLAGLRGGLRPVDRADRRDRRNRALDFPAHWPAVLLVQPGRPRDELGRPAGVGSLSGLGSAIGA